MKNIITFINESSNQNKAMFDACIALENEQSVYAQYKALADSVCKKIKKNEFDFDHLANSSSIDKLITACLKLAKTSVTSETRKTLRKYFAGLVLKHCQGDMDLPKDIEDLLIEWDYYNKLDW